jgi:hypothetical protein
MTAARYSQPMVSFVNSYCAYYQDFWTLDPDGVTTESKS